jgi:peptidyl-prolyl cis-trans isomerase D
VTVSRDDAKKLPTQVVDAALRSASASLPAQIGVDLGAAGYEVVKVLKSVPREVPAAGQALQERTQYARQWTTAENLAYYESLKARFKVRILAPKPSDKSVDKAA